MLVWIWILSIWLVCAFVSLYMEANRRPGDYPSNIQTTFDLIAYGPFFILIAIPVLIYARIKSSLRR